MAPSLAIVQVQPGVILPIRIFINRRRIAKSLQEATTSFETPLLPNNSIIRLKSPLIRLFLSNSDSKSLCNEIRAELMLILYELTAKEIHEEVLGKIKVGNLVEMKDIMTRFPSFRHTKHSDTTSCHLTTLERSGKHQYKLHYENNWELDIFVSDMRKLARIRSTLLQRLNFRPNSSSGLIAPIGDLSKTKVLRRVREEIVSKQEASSEPKLLLESDEEDVFPESGGNEKEPTSNVLPEMIDVDSEKKPKFKFSNVQMLNLGNCIDIHILKRPARAKMGRS